VVLSGLNPDTSNKRVGVHV